MEKLGREIAMRQAVATKPLGNKLGSWQEKGLDGFGYYNITLYYSRILLQVFLQILLQVNHFSSHLRDWWHSKGRFMFGIVCWCVGCAPCSNLLIVCQICQAEGGPDPRSMSLERCYEVGEIMAQVGPGNVLCIYFSCSYSKIYIKHIKLIIELLVSASSRCGTNKCVVHWSTYCRSWTSAERRCALHNPPPKRRQSLAWPERFGFVSWRRVDDLISDSIQTTV